MISAVDLAGLPLDSLSYFGSYMLETSVKLPFLSPSFFQFFVSWVINNHLLPLINFMLVNQGTEVKKLPCLHRKLICIAASIAVAVSFAFWTLGHWLQGSKSSPKAFLKDVCLCTNPVIASHTRMWLLFLCPDKLIRIDSFEGGNQKTSVIWDTDFALLLRTETSALTSHAICFGSILFNFSSLRKVFNSEKSSPGSQNWYSTIHY